MAWRAAHSLDVLRDEINAIAPGRSTASDGTIGDEAHQGSPSDHNPNAKDVVCARDFTHDPGKGADMHVIAARIVAKRPKALKYVIWNKRIWSVARAGEGWRAYGGSNPHTAHMHVSVGVGSDGQSTGPYDDKGAWGIADLDGKPSAPSKPKPSKSTKAPGPHYDFPLGSGRYFGPKGGPNSSVSGYYGRRFKGKTDREWLRIFGEQLRKRGWDARKGGRYLTRSGNDGFYGPEYRALVRAFQADQGLAQDGLIGPKTWRAAFENRVT